MSIGGHHGEGVAGLGLKVGDGADRNRAAGCVDREASGITNTRLEAVGEGRSIGGSGCINNRSGSHVFIDRCRGCRGEDRRRRVTPTDGDSVSGIGDGAAKIASLVGHAGHKGVRPCRQDAGGETPGAVRGASDGGRAQQNAAVEDADRVSSGERSAVGTRQGWRLVVGGAIAGHRTGLDPEVVGNGRDACRAGRSDGVEGDPVGRTRRALVAGRVGNAGGVAD